MLHQRLAAYRAQTAPLVAYYREKGVLRTVNGMAPIPEVTAAIDKALPPEPPLEPARGRLKKKAQSHAANRVEGGQAKRSRQ